MREHTLLDKEIRETMTKGFPLPEKVKSAQEAAFAQIRGIQAAEEAPQKQKRGRNVFYRTCGSLGAAAAVFCVVCMANPAFAAQIPLVGRVFEALGDSLGFSGDYSGYAEPLEEDSGDSMTEGTGQETDLRSGDFLYSQTKNGMTVSLSEVYCNDAALYISMVIESEEEFPETMIEQNGRPSISLQDSTLKFDYNPQEILAEIGGGLDGKFIDSHTYAGALRFGLSDSQDASRREAYEKDRDRFVQTLGITEQELAEDPSGAYEKVCQILGLGELTDESLAVGIAEAGGPDWEDYKKEVSVPETFGVKLSIPMVVGYKASSDSPEMPEDLKAAYEQAMTEKGLGLTDEAYSAFSQEQKEIEHELFTKMWNEYTERFPETNEHPNRYENWWVEGPWEFSLDVEKNSKGTIVKEIGDVNDRGLGLVSVTKTPFEITIDDGRPGADYFTVALDANGDILDYGNNSNTNTFAIQDRDVSKIDVYICDYTEYMDELKGYYWSEDYENKKKEKTFKQLLDERALYHREIVFDEYIDGD